MATISGQVDNEERAPLLRYVFHVVIGWLFPGYRCTVRFKHQDKILRCIRPLGHYGFGWRRQKHVAFGSTARNLKGPQSWH